MTWRQRGCVDGTSAHVEWRGYSAPFFYRLDHLDGPTGAACLTVMGLCLAVSYGSWTRYVTRGRACRQFFEPLGVLPLPMAVMPITYFFTASALLRSPSLLTATIVFAAGHLYLTNRERVRTALLEMD